ncbi:MAG TPA: TauD/TfdA family dioxygenase [Kofleriaceae bacterium]|jgi:alpha-ketoglutarate-dependent taurine dioxygenase
MVERVHVLEGKGESPTTIPRDEKIALLREHGALLLRGFAVDTKRVRDVAFELGRNFYNMQLDPKVRELVSEDGIVAGVLKGSAALPMHMERGYSPLKPELVFFHVVEPSLTGGESLLCSGARALAEMSPSTRTLLQTKRLEYKHEWEPQAWMGRYGKTKEDVAAVFAKNPSIVEHHFVGDVLHYTYVVSAIVQSRLGGQPAFCNNFIGAWLVHHATGADRPPAIYDHSVRFEDGQEISRELFEEVRASVGRAIEVHAIEAGDVVVLDNYRFMHGRNAFEGKRVMHAMFADAQF